MDTAQKILLSVGLSTEEFDKRLLASQDKVQGLISTKQKLNAELEKKLDSGEIVKGSKAFDDMRTAINRVSAEQKLATTAMRELEKQQQNVLKVNDETENSNQQLKATLSILTSEYNKLSEAEKLNTDKGQTLKTSITEITDTLKANESAVGNNFRSVGDYAKIVGPLVDALKKENVILGQNNEELMAQRKNIADILKPTEQQKNKIGEINAQLEIGNQLYAENEAKINKLTSSMGFLATQEDKMGDNTNAASNTIAGMQQRLVELNKTLQSTDVGSKQFKDASTEAQKLKLGIDQALGKVNEFGDKEPKNLTKKAFSDTAEAGAGLVSIVSLATVAFGNNEKASEAQAAVIKAVAVSQLAMNAAKGVGAIMDVAALVKTKALTAAQFLYGQVVGKSTVAMKLFKVALAGTGIGAVVILLGELIFNFKEVSKWVEKFTNGIKDWTAEISGGNKAIAQLVNIITTIGSPLLFVIKLINDFQGTLSSLQNSVNDLFNSLTDRFGKFGELMKAGLVPFNLFINAVKSLGGETKKYKIDLESVTKMHEKYNAQLDKDANKRKQQIDIAKAQGKSERDLHILTKDNLDKTTKARQIEFDNVLRIMKAKKKTYQTLSEEEAKLYDEIKGALDQSIVDQMVYDADLAKQQRDAAKERYKERLDLERSLQHELILLRNGFIKDEFDKQRADLTEQQRIDKEANDLAIIDATKKFGEKSQIVADLQEKNKLQLQKFNDDMFAIDVAQADREIDALSKQNETEAQIRRESFIKQVEDLQTQANIEKDIKEASFINTGKTNSQRFNQEQQHKNDLLGIELKFLQQKLQLAEQFASKDGIISPKEVEQLRELATAIGLVQEKIKQGEGAKVIDGLGLTQKDMQAIELAASSILSILDTIKSVIDANAANQMRAIDDRFKYEEAAIQHSTASQEEKEEKIAALNKKSAMEKYKIELEQFQSNKAISIVNTIITTAQAVMAALANPTPFAGPILAAIAAATGATQLGIIASQPPPPKPQFFDGGFTENGNPREKSRYSNDRYDLHKGEFVTANRVLQKPEAWPHVRALANMHTDTPGYLGLGGFADGGFTARQLSNETLSSMEFQRAISLGVAEQIKGLKIYTRATDIGTSLKSSNENKINSRVM